NFFHPALRMLTEQILPSRHHSVLKLLFKLFKTRGGGLLVRRPVFVLLPVDADSVPPAVVFLSCQILPSPRARLRSGTANSTTFPPGDQTWVTISAGAGLMAHWERRG